MGPPKLFFHTGTSRVSSFTATNSPESGLQITTRLICSAALPRRPYCIAPRPSVHPIGLVPPTVRNRKAVETSNLVVTSK